MPNSMTRATGGCARPPTPHPGIGEIIGAGKFSQVHTHSDVMLPVHGGEAKSHPL